MMTRRVRCTKCQFPMDPVGYSSGAFHRCQQCKAPSQVEVFPALLAPPRVGEIAEALQIEGESSCFYHPAKKAVVPCDGCGRFLCALCEIDLGGQKLCSSCIETGNK